MADLPVVTFSDRALPVTCKKYHMSHISKDIKWIMAALLRFDIS